ncbi:MAG: VacB/RNase II family 3'-5' exoribonuclease [Gammaproteobacteria bacterium]|nr:VacB/RNase II family 3'-5' exoribonuclease [Gammaproteobacteria bacterium]
MSEGKQPAKASAIVRLLRAEPMPYRDLRRHFADGAALRAALKQLARDGRIVRDHAGMYLPEPADRFTGLIEAGLRGLTVEGLPLEAGGRSALREGDRVEALRSQGRARVLRVLEHSAEPLAGVFRTTARGAYIETLGGGARGRLALSDASSYAKDGDIVRACVTGVGPRGLIVRIEQVIGGESVVDTASEAAVTAYAIPACWPPGVDSAAKAAPRQVAATDHAGRIDLRHLPLVTIDGPSARDFDDAVYAEAGGEGWRLVVAIADVAHYVAPGSALDAAARERGTSVYFPERVIPMLPEALSNGICSLRPDEDRLALVCDMRVSRKGRIARYEFNEALIRSQARLTYAEVEAWRCNGNGQPHGVAKSLGALFSAYGALRRAREARGALDFDAHEGAPELRGAEVAAIKPTRRLDSHRLIEEAMIAANVCAAEFLESRGRARLQRVHEPPDPTKLAPLSQAFASVGAPLPEQKRISAKALQKSLSATEQRPDGWLFALLTLQSMQRAHYAPEGKGHFALALDRYAHFTSPIRRYPDLTVHRAIKAVLHGQPESGGARRMLAEAGAQASLAERRADDAARMVDAWLKCGFLAPRIGETFAATVAGVAEFGLFADLDGYFIQGLLHVSALGDDYFRHAPPFRLVGEATGASYALGDAIKVRLAGAQPELGRLDLELADVRSRRRGGPGARRHGGGRGRRR